MALKENYKDDLYDGQRRYNQVKNQDGTVSLVDATTYTQKGDSFGANDMNAMTVEINKMETLRPAALLSSGWGAAAPFTQRVDVAGIRSGDNPLVFIDPSMARATRKAQEKALHQCVDRVTVYDGYVIFECDEKKPGVNLNVLLKGV